MTESERNAAVIQARKIQRALNIAQSEVRKVGPVDDPHLKAMFTDALELLAGLEKVFADFGMKEWRSPFA